MALRIIYTQTIRTKPIKFEL